MDTVGSELGALTEDGRPPTRATIEFAASACFELCVPINVGHNCAVRFGLSHQRQRGLSTAAAGLYCLGCFCQSQNGAFAQFASCAMKFPFGFNFSKVSNCLNLLCSNFAVLLHYPCETEAAHIEQAAHLRISRISQHGPITPVINYKLPVR